MLRYDGQVRYDGLLWLSSHGEMVSCLLRKYEIAWEIRARESSAIVRHSVTIYLSRTSKVE